MLFTFLLSSVLAMSAVLGRSSGTSPKQMTYEKEHKTVMQSEETAQIMAVDDRSSTLKFLMAIKSSSIWAEIQKRSLTINTPQGLEETVDEKSLNNLSDQELAQLKQACNDGLKCVAVDQLLVLKQVKSPISDGKVSVRTAITKITQVLTQYTTEYHEDVYQYEAVSDSDDESTVYKSVTTIVEDNKELCRIDLTPATQESHPKNDDAVPAIIVNNNNTVNYNTTNNYNINNGTVNSATITKEPSDITTVVESPEPGTQTNSSNPRLVVVIRPTTETNGGDEHTKNQSPDNDIPAGRYAANGPNESETKAPGNDDEYNPVRRNYARDSGTYDRSYEPVTTTGDQYARSADDNRAPSGYSNREENNNVSLQNGVGNSQNAGETDSNHDIVSAGSGNTGVVRKGFVEDGTLNNGSMVQHNINNGTINKGTISDSSAKNGIINVGTVNNGPVNYGSANTYTNNGKQMSMDNYDVQKYLSNIDKMYSTILERLG